MKKEDVKCKESIFRRCYANANFWLLLSSSGLFSGVHTVLDMNPQSCPRAPPPPAEDSPTASVWWTTPCPAHQPASPGLRNPCSCHLATRTWILHFITSEIRLEIPWQGLQQHRVVCLPTPSLLRATHGTKRQRTRSWSETDHWLTSCGPSRTVCAVACKSNKGHTLKPGMKA